MCIALKNSERSLIRFKRRVFVFDLEILYSREESKCGSCDERFAQSLSVGEICRKDFRVRQHLKETNIALSSRTDSYVARCIVLTDSSRPSNLIARKATHACYPKARFSPAMNDGKRAFRRARGSFRTA